MEDLLSAMTNAVLSLVSFFGMFSYFYSLLIKNRNTLDPGLFFVCDQLKNPVLVAVILVTGIGGTFQYGFHISVLTAPSAVSNSVCFCLRHQLVKGGMREILKDLL